MKKNIVLTISIILISVFVLSAQGKKPDEIHLKYFGTVKGNVIKIKKHSVEFRSEDNDLLYDYPKEDINYIILSTGEWISFSDENNLSGKESSGWGYFNLAGGGIVNLKPLNESDIRKNGISVFADLNYQFNQFYSMGFQLGYSEVKLNKNNFLAQNGYSGTNNTVSGGTSYLMSAGLINRIFVLPGSSVKPAVLFFLGYGNLLISETDVNYISGKNVFPDVSKTGFMSGVGLEFLIGTGTNSGFILGSRYNWLFHKDEKIHFLNFNLGYVIPIN